MDNNKKEKRNRIEDWLCSIDNRLEKIETKPIRKEGVVSVFRFAYDEFESDEFWNGNKFIDLLKKNYIHFNIDDNIAEFSIMLKFELEEGNIIAKFPAKSEGYNLIIVVNHKEYDIFLNRVIYFLESDLMPKKK